MYCALFERLTNVLKQCVSAGEHHDSGNASVPVCSMTQLDIWLSIRQNKRVLRDPHAGDFVDQGNAGRNEVHRTTLDPKPATVPPCTCGDWREPSRLACPCVKTSAGNTSLNCTLITTVTGTRVVRLEWREENTNRGESSWQQLKSTGADVPRRGDVEVVLHSSRVWTKRGPVVQHSCTRKHLTSQPHHDYRRTLRPNHTPRGLAL